MDVNRFKFQKYFDFEEYGMDTFEMLYSELIVEKENVLKNFYLKNSMFCAKNCYFNYSIQYYKCYDKCTGLLLKRMSIRDSILINTLKNIGSDGNNPESNDIEQTPQKRKKKSDDFDFPDYMYSKGKPVLL